MDSEEGPLCLEHDDGAIVQNYNTEDSAEEQGTDNTDMEDHNYSLSPSSNIELKHGNTTNAMLLSTGSDQPEIKQEYDQMYSLIVIMNQMLYRMCWEILACWMFVMSKQI